MSKRPATSFSPDDPTASLGVLALPVTLAAGEGGTAAPEWIQIAPRGRVEARDGRSFAFNPEALVSRFDTDGIDIPVDLDHSAAYGFSEAKVVGWIDRLDARPDGLYGRVDWLADGRAVLAARTRRYVSPSIRHNEDGTATWIHSVALVAAPALSMPALASADPDQPEDPRMKTIAATLGLAETSTEAAVLAALNARLAATVDKAVHDQALANLAATTDRLKDVETQFAALAAAGHQAKVDAVLDAALKDKRIVPAQREQYARLAATPEGLDQVKAIIDASPAVLGASGLDDRQPSDGGGGVRIAQEAARLAAEITTYIGEQARTGVVVDPATALRVIQSRKPNS
jgi:phage I-like protein